VKNEESQSNESVESIVETNTTEEIDDIETTATDETQQTEQAAEQIAAEVLKSVEESGTNTTPPDNTIAKETEDGEHKNEECGSAPAKRNRFMSKENFDDDMLD